jgi:hypothetical protein
MSASDSDLTSGDLAARTDTDDLQWRQSDEQIAGLKARNAESAKLKIVGKRDKV